MATFTVAVLGGAGGIGQPLSLLLKLNPRIKDLRLYDVVKHTPGVAKDLDHICTSGPATGFWDAPNSKNKPNLIKALIGVDLVLIPAGVPRKPGMSRDDLFGVNAGIIVGLCQGIAKACPEAMVSIICNPVNSTVPIAAEVFKAAGCYNPRKLCGVTQLDLTRSCTFWGATTSQKPGTVSVPVVGGHSGVTILPLLSQAVPQHQQSAADVEALTRRIQGAGSEVVKLKAGAGSATLSMAYSAAVFADLCLQGLGGSPREAYAYIQSDVMPGLSFFASKIMVGPKGIAKIYGVGDMNAYEQKLMEEVKPALKSAIDKGIKYARSKL